MRILSSKEGKQRMKILHTSDWHLNEKLGQIDRQPDICARLEEIAGYLEQEKVDVMLVSGDIFSNTIRLDQVRTAFTDVSRIYRPFFARGGTIIGIGGNHDGEDLFNVIRLAMDMAAPQLPSSTKPKDPGRLYLFERSGYMSLLDKEAGEVQFCLLPYPIPSRYLQGDMLNYKTTDEKNSRLHTELRNRLLKIQSDFVRPKFPAVLVSHLNVRGTKLHNLYHLSESQDVVFDLADLPLSWAYSAFGHIHLPHKIHENANAQYAGSIERFDFAEAGDKKSVVLLEIGKGGLVGTPALLPLNATPLYKVLVHGQADLAGLAERYPEAQRAIVDYQIVYKSGEENPDAMRETVEKIFPRCFRRRTDPEGSEYEEPEGTGVKSLAIENVPEYVRTYLGHKLAEHVDRDDLLRLAEELLAMD